MAAAEASTAGRDAYRQLHARWEIDRSRQERQRHGLQYCVVETAAARINIIEITASGHYAVDQHLSSEIQTEPDIIAVLQPDPDLGGINRRERSSYVVRHCRGRRVADCVRGIHEEGFRP